MELTWNKDSNAYRAAAQAVLDKYGEGGSFIVQLKIRYNLDEEWRDITELLIDEGNYPDSNYIWEYDWWEGQRFVELIAAAPVSEIDISEAWRI